MSPQQPLDRRGQVGRLGREHCGAHRHRELGRRGGDGRLHRRRRRLGHQQHPLGGRDRRREQRARRGWPGRRPPRRDRGRRRRGRARRRRRPCRAGRRSAGRRCRTPRRGRPGRGGRRWRSRARRPETIAVPQSGPMTRTPASCAACFSATSCSTGTPSEKTRTLRPAAIASAASATAYGAGHGDDREGRGVGRQVVEPGADRALRDGGGGAGGALAGGQGGVDGGLGRGQHLGVVGPDGDEQLLGRGVLVGGQAHAGRELEVERRGHGDQDGGDAVPGADVAAHLHELHRVGVDPRSEHDRAHSGWCGRGSGGGCGGHPSGPYREMSQR